MVPPYISAIMANSSRLLVIVAVYSVGDLNILSYVSTLFCDEPNDYKLVCPIVYMVDIIHTIQIVSYIARRETCHQWHKI